MIHDTMNTEGSLEPMALSHVYNSNNCATDLDMDMICTELSSDTGKTRLEALIITNIQTEMVRFIIFIMILLRRNGKTNLVWSRLSQFTRMEQSSL